MQEAGAVTLQDPGVFGECRSNHRCHWLTPEYQAFGGGLGDVADFAVCNPRPGAGNPLPTPRGRLGIERGHSLPGTAKGGEGTVQCRADANRIPRFNSGTDRPPSLTADQVPARKRSPRPGR